MLVVKVEFHNDVTHEIREMGRMIIFNDGAGSHELSNYVARIASPNEDLGKILKGKFTNEGRIREYDMLKFPVWNLVQESIEACYRKGKKDDTIMG